MEQYAEIKRVLNRCPSCKAQSVYRMRFIHPDEGRMTCQQCKNEQARVEYENDLERDVQIAKDELHGYLGDINLVWAIENLITALIKRGEL